MAAKQDLMTQNVDILVVDDSTVNLQLLSEILINEGYQVYSTENSQLALESARAQLPSLILLDVKLPGVSGFELCQQLKQDERTRDIPIILMNELQDIQSRTQGFEVGGVDFISKPFEGSEVLARVKNQLQFREMQLNLEKLVSKRTAELKTVNQTLREIEEKYQTVIESSNDMIWTLDKKGKFTYFNKKAEDIAGYKLEEERSKEYTPIILEEDLKMVQDVYRRTIQGEQLNYEVRIHDTSRKKLLTLSVNTAPIYKNDEIIGTVNFGRDITKRKKVEQEMRDSNEKIQALFDVSPDIVHLVDINGIILSTNRVFLKTLGLELDDVIGKSVFDFDGTKAQPERKEALNKVCSTGEPLQLETIGERGSIFDSYLHPVFNPEGEVKAVAIYARNITTRKHAQGMLRASEEKFKTLVTNSEQIVFMIAKDGTFLLIEGKGLSKFGLKPGEVVGQSVFELGKNIPDTLDFIRKALNGEDISSEENVGGIHLRNWFSPQKDDKGEIIGLLGLSVDITKEKQASEALIQSQERYRALSEASFEAIFISEKGVCIEQNSNAEKMFGYTLSEAIGSKGTEWIAPEDREMVMNNMLSSCEERYEATALRKDGSTFPAEIQGRMMYYKGNTVRVTALNDISDRKRAMEDLQESEEKYRVLVEQAQDGIIVLQDGKVKFANPIVENLLGYTPKDLVNRDFTKHVSPDELQKVTDIYRKRINNESVPSVYESAIQHKDGSRVDVEFNAGLMVYDGKLADQVIIRDIRKRKWAEQALRESEEKYRTLVEQAQDGIVIIQDGKVKFANTTVEKLFGYTPEEFINHEFTKYVSPDELPKVADTYRKRMNSKSVPSVYETAIQHKDGSRVDVEFNSGLTMYESKLATQVIIRDIRKRKRIEEKLRESEQQLSGIINSISDFMCMIDRDHNLVWANEVAKNLFGQDIIGEKCYTYFHRRETICEDCLASKTFNDGQTHEHPVDYTDNDGNEWTYLCKSNVASYDKNGKPRLVVEISRDITESKQAEDILRESEERFRAAFEQASVGIAYMALDGRFLRINQKLCGIVGYSFEEMQRLSFQEITHPDDLGEDLENFRLLLAGEIDSFALERKYLHKEGGIVWVNVTSSLLKHETGEPGWFVSIVEDITERKELQGERDRILNLSQDLICIMGIDGYIKYINPAWEQVLGYTEEELLSKNFLDFTSPEDHDKNNAEVEKMMRGQHRMDFENRFIHKDGSVRHISWVSIPVLEDKVWYCTGRDVTESKEAELRLKKYQKRLKELASELTRVEERERSRIAAELHDHVGQVLAVSRMQLVSARKATSDSKLIAALDEVSETLQLAIQDTRTLVFELSSPLLNEIGLAAAISEWLETHIDHKYQIKTELIHDGYPISLNDDVQRMIFRSVRELLINVVKYAKAKRVTIHLESDDNLLRISVKDDGVGFNKDLLSEEIVRGSGFGLFSIQERMIDLGGSMEIISKPAKGCEVVLAIPLSMD